MSMNTEPKQYAPGTWLSIAYWPLGEVRLGNSDNSSTDEHGSEDQALAICARLEREGFGGQGRIFPIRTEVRPAPDAHGENERCKDEVEQGHELSSGYIEVRDLVIKIRESIAAFCPADENIEERGTLDALNVLFSRIANGHWPSEQGHEPWPNTPGAREHGAPAAEQPPNMLAYHFCERIAKCVTPREYIITPEDIEEAGAAWRQLDAHNAATTSPEEKEIQAKAT